MKIFSSGFLSRLRLFLASVFAGLASAAGAGDATLPPPPETAASSPGAIGWGRKRPAYFDATQVNVVNRARGGRNSRTFFTEGLWEAVVADLKAGDVVLIQFGHNDAGLINDAQRACGTIRGVGEESEAIDNQLTGKPEVVRSYGWYLRRFIADARAKGAHPVVASPVPRKRWTYRINRDRYAEWANAVASEEGVPFLDLNERVAVRYEAMGSDAVNALFADEHTHTGKAGADLNAEIVVEVLKALPQNPLKPFLAKTRM